MDKYVLFHTHGLGRFDFSTMEGSDLPAINTLAAERQAYVCPTVYLAREMVRPFKRVLERFAEGSSRGEFPRILGFAVEGPVLGPKGGTPTGSVWKPDAQQWAELTSCFALGLKYIVISPDAVALDEELDAGFTFGDLISLVYGSGGRIALGHFSDNVAVSESAGRIGEILAFIEARFRRSPYLVLTDHLFNDMPRSFRHAFRSDADRLSRERELAPVLESPWLPSTLPNLLGAVPAALIDAAREGRLTPSLNFDGGHVDLDVCRQVVRYLGASRVIAITDHTEIVSLAGEALTRAGELLYRHDGVLAASGVCHEMQRMNMLGIGLSDAEISQAFYATPLAALQFRPQPVEKHVGVP